ncbi:hypothetical protein D9Q98_009473 [Chlorella vulgaris]|uniref:ABC transporter domain-containing protein n=1 Tax=Chlorella vulgaris TaxID=3077 RepID=A0A9D4TF97_CHLVU|nr:hypothetical protein D9Q98_009473 [Chlorella vulgaris]
MATLAAAASSPAPPARQQFNGIAEAPSRRLHATAAPHRCRRSAARTQTAAAAAASAAAAATGLSAAISVSGVDLTFRGRGVSKQVLDGVCLEVPRGSFHMLLGANGCGKSTLLRVVAGLFQPEAGTVQVDAPCAVVFQNPDHQVVMPSVGADVAFGLGRYALAPEAVQSLVRDSLARVGLDGFAERPAASLSGGQKQRVAIAGALAECPRVLLLDELTTFLDYEDQENVLQCVRGIVDSSRSEAAAAAAAASRRNGSPDALPPSAEGVTALWVTHRLEELQYADSVSYMDGGRIVFSGSPEKMRRYMRRLGAPRARRLSTPTIAAAKAGRPVEMEVTRHNFKEVLPLVKQALADCQFYAIDCEMTGLFLEDNKAGPLDDIEERYSEQTLASSRAFVINQFGLSAFVWEGGAYRPRTFNFYLFPRPSEGSDKRFVCQSSSIEFLASCNFDFNKVIYDGIGYTTVVQRDARLASVDRPHRERSEVLVRKAEDVAFVADIVAAVTQWMQGDAPDLLLPPVNSYQRLLQYQELRRPQFGAAEAPGFYVERVPNTAEGGSGFQLRLTRASAAEVEAWEAGQRQKRIDGIHTAAGFAAVMEAMRDSGKPAVGHNLSFDLAFSLHSYAEELPGSWEEYKALVGRWFPGGVYDTKHLSGLMPALFPDTSLGSLHDGLLKGELQPEVAAFLSGQAEEGASTEGEEGEEVPAVDGTAQLPVVEHAAGFERYKGVETQAYAHEAGYDAYMTGAAFACLVRVYEAAAAAASGTAAAQPAEQQPQLDAVQHLCWRMNISRSDIPYAALQGEDPAPDRSHIFHLSGWDTSYRVFGGDVARKLADSGLGPVRVSVVEGGRGALVEVGDAETVMGAADVLQQRFPSWTVAPYAQYGEKRRQQRQDAAAAAAAEREAAAAAAAARRNGGGNKRPRVAMEAGGAARGVPAAAAAVLGGGSEGPERGRCSVM